MPTSAGVKDYDVVVVGGGINGLTVAAYLAKAGLSVGVFEARGQCGAHCDTVELGIPGFLHNLHATWLVPSVSPAMGRSCWCSQISPRPEDGSSRSTSTLAGRGKSPSR